VVANSTEGAVHVVVPAGTDTYQIRARSQDAATTVTARSDSESLRLIRARSQTGDVRVVQRRNG